MRALSGGSVVHGWELEAPLVRDRHHHRRNPQLLALTKLSPERGDDRFPPKHYNCANPSANCDSTVFLQRQFAHW